MLFRVDELNDSRAKDWEELNENSPQGTLFHTLKWKRLLEDSFRFTARYFLLYRDHQPVALCPFFVRRSFGFSGFVSLPDPTLNPCDHLVVCTESGVLENSLEILEELATMEGMSFIIFGVCEEQRSTFARIGMPLHELGGRMVLDLSKNPPDRIWRVIFRNNQRNKIRRFDKDGFTLDRLTSPEGIGDFYAYYAANLRRMGGRPFPLSFFERLWTTYSSDSTDGVMLTVLKKNECVAGGLLALFWDARKILYWRYFSLNRSLPSVYTPYYYLLWHAIQDAHEMGCRVVDFGGVNSDSSDVHFRMKSEFGCSYVPKYGTVLPASHPTRLLLAIKSLANSRFAPSSFMRVVNCCRK